MARALEKYLDGYSEPEARRALGVSGQYDRAVIVPVCRESASFLDGITAAARSSSGRTLCITVVNARDDVDRAVHAENAELLSALKARSGKSLRRLSDAPPTFLGTIEGMDVLFVDRASPGNRFPRRQGVGLARKIGADIALALHADGRSGPLLFFTDADACLPEGHFDVEDSLAAERALLSFPFWHAASEDAALDRATALYEVSLRYYVAGLRHAGSPYAVHTLGSALAVSARAYAAVRGVPRREAGEDFYLVNKLLKVGPASSAGSRPVVLRARRSDRTPFGTGRGVDKLERAELHLYDPRGFGVLRSVLGALVQFSHDRSFSGLTTHLLEQEPIAGPTVVRLLESLNGPMALATLCRTFSSSEALGLAVQRWFDGFRTLKLVHALRNAHWPALPWREALRSAPFFEGTVTDAAAARAVLFEREAAVNLLARPAPQASATSSVAERGRQ